MKENKKYFTGICIKLIKKYFLKKVHYKKRTVSTATEDETRVQSGLFVPLAQRRQEQAKQKPLELEQEELNPEVVVEEPHLGGGHDAEDDEGLGEVVQVVQQQELGERQETEHQFFEEFDVEAKLYQIKRIKLINFTFSLH